MYVMPEPNAARGVLLSGSDSPGRRGRIRGIRATRHLDQSCRATAISRMVHAPSTMVAWHGSMEHTHPLRSTHSFHPRFKTELYPQKTQHGLRPRHTRARSHYSNSRRHTPCT